MKAVLLTLQACCCGQLMRVSILRGNSSALSGADARRSLLRNGLGETMMVAGIGCRPGAAAAEIIVAVDAALEQHQRRREALSCLATGAVKRQEAGIVLAAGELGVPLHYVAEEALADVEQDLLTSSNFSLAATGSPSLSESSALAAAGRGSRLLGPRVVAGHVTCALAVLEQAP